MNVPRCCYLSVRQLFVFRSFFGVRRSLLVTYRELEIEFFKVEVAVEDS